MHLHQGVFPSDLKQAKVIPLHKGGSRLDENNYRPISLLKVWIKIFERAMFVRLYQYFGILICFMKSNMVSTKSIVQLMRWLTFPKN